MRRSLQSIASSVIVIIKRSREPLSLATAEAPPTSLWKQVQPISICSELLWKPALCSCVKSADVSPIWSEQSQQYVNVCSRRGPKVAIKSGLLGPSPGPRRSRHFYICTFEVWMCFTRVWLKLCTDLLWWCVLQRIGYCITPEHEHHLVAEGNIRQFTVSPLLSWSRPG